MNAKPNSIHKQKHHRKRSGGFHLAGTAVVRKHTAERTAAGAILTPAQRKKAADEAYWQGYADGCKRVSEKLNPFTAGTAQWHAWRKGWTEAREEEPCCG